MSSRFVLLGHPVAHSLSPAIHAAAYRALGLEHRYELLDTPDQGALEGALRAIRSGEIAGANVTVPWKRTALALADAAHASASDVGAANVLACDPAGTITAHNTDVAALIDELGALAPKQPRVLVLGNGGAALAAVAAARALGAKSLWVSARKWTSAVDRASWPHAADFGALGAEPLAWDGSGAGTLAGAVPECELVVQATSSGMHGGGPGEDVANAVPWSRLPSGAAVYDLVYNPAETEFLRCARASGHTARGGLGMLVGQAARAVELWLGVSPPREPMLRAAAAALEARQA